MISVSLMLYFTLAVGSADIKGNLSDSEVVYRTTGSPGQILHDKRVTDAIFYSCSRVRKY